MDLLRKFERVVKIALIVMLIVSAGLISAWLLSANKKEEPDVSLGGVAEQNEVSSNTRLADKLDLLPDKCTLNMDLSNLTFSGENGEKIALSGLRAKQLF